MSQLFRLTIWGILLIGHGFFGLGCSEDNGDRQYVKGSSGDSRTGDQNGDAVMGYTGDTNLFSGDDAGECKQLIKAYQVEGEPCCEDWGEIACERGYFCEQFTSDDIARCHENWTQNDMAECHADYHCASGSCNRNVNQCQSSPEASCTSSIGCADYTDGSSFGCDIRQATPVCARLAGNLFSLCLHEVDCHSELSCVGNSCLLNDGQACTEHAECVSNFCDDFLAQCGTEAGHACNSETICSSSACMECDRADIYCKDSNNHAECLTQCLIDDSYRIYACQEAGETCASGVDDECVSFICLDGFCRVEDGQACDASSVWWEYCRPYRECISCSLSGVQCVSTEHDYECLENCGNGQYANACE